MRPDTLKTIRLATAFYGLLAFAAVVYAFLFGHLERLLGERVPEGGGLGRGLAYGLAIVLVSNAALLFSRHVRTAADMMGRFLGPLGPGIAIYLAAKWRNRLRPGYRSLRQHGANHDTAIGKLPDNFIRIAVDQVKIDLIL